MWCWLFDDDSMTLSGQHQIFTDITTDWSTPQTSIGFTGGDADSWVLAFTRDFGASSGIRVHCHPSNNKTLSASYVAIRPPPGFRDRNVDAGLVIQVFTRKYLKINNVIFDMQAFGDDPIAIAGASTELVMLNCPGCMREYKKHKTVFLGGYGVTPFQLMCKDNLRRVADFKGKKVRAVGAGKRWVSGMGAVPVAMPPTERVTAMRRGAINCLVGSIAWMRSRRTCSSGVARTSGRGIVSRSSRRLISILCCSMRSRSRESSSRNSVSTSGNRGS